MEDPVLLGNRKFLIANNSNIDIQVFPYLTQKLWNLNINVMGDYKGHPIDLMKNHYLQNWCYESTNTAIVFFNDTDFIERGSVVVYPNERISHSWILFSFRNQEFVLDLALNVLCKKELYDSLFETHVDGYSSALKTRNYLMQKLLNPPKVEYSKDCMRFLKKLEPMSGELSGNQKDIIQIYGSDCIYAPMYRGSMGYVASIENGKIKSLSANFYKSCV